ncbi:hypothetical protein CDL12_29947 [Handroanthus impetiginosus]|uniref:Uncharacterized protein n=1 Tax=Handroanthus impetiginosus TaxID=429701 RepID=A0A2G9FXC3_9LAMI|nr:hypothetical protein CDL12_29947 [Handroanthus impetiginosus]
MSIFHVLNLSFSLNGACVKIGTAMRPKKALGGLYGVRLASHSPFLFEETKQDGDFNKPPRRIINFGSDQLRIVKRVWHQRAEFFKPIHYCHIDDESPAESVANVLTSLPFISLGLQAPRKNLNCKIYANSIIGVGLASGFYHASKGKLKRYLRWADYTMIATATMCLTGAIKKENPKLLMAASALALPIKPLMVTAVHTGIMEVAFAKRANENPDLRMAHNVHTASSLLGGSLFLADSLFPEAPFVHAGWHLAAAMGVLTCNKLLE